MRPTLRLIDVIARCILLLAIALICRSESLALLTGPSSDPSSLASIAGLAEEGEGEERHDASDAQGESADEGEPNGEARLIEHHIGWFACSAYELSFPQIREPRSRWIDIDPGPART